ncbi:jg27158 [Pararge aegeria aegeria]|uniref:Jg27158 protein n=1 Tax=Pararge aegeria aegeria TaxID=348720 RepID=A0A8S4QFM5_9NEOP|nr:jg27158 [Pararge aegeria aegeria]
MGVPCAKEEIDIAKRIGKENHKCRPIIISLTTTWKKMEIKKNKKALDNFPIYIKEDFPPKVIQKRIELQQQLKIEREQGKKVALRYDKIITLHG